MTKEELLRRTPTQRVRERERTIRTAEAQRVYEKQVAEQQAMQEAEQTAYEKEIGRLKLMQKQREEGYKAGYKAAFTGETISGDYPKEWKAAWYKGRQAGVRPAASQFVATKAAAQARAQRIFDVPEKVKEPVSLFEITQKPSAFEQAAGFEISSTKTVPYSVEDKERYEKMGYTSYEAKKLAEYSAMTQTTPTPQAMEESGLLFKKVSFKEDVLGKSGAYYIAPFIGQKVVEGIEKISPKFKEFKKQKDRPSPSWLSSAVQSAPLWIFFSPAMATGLTQKEEFELVAKTTKKRFEYVGVEKKLASLKSSKAKAKYLKEYLKRAADVIKKEKSPELQKKAVENIRNMLKDLIDKKLITPTKYIPKTVPPPTTTKETIDISMRLLAPDFAQMEQVAVVGIMASIGKPDVSKRDEVFFPAEFGTTELFKPTTTEVTAPAMVQDIFLPQKEAQISAEKILSISTSALQPKIKQTQKEIQKLKEAQLTKVKTAQITKPVSMVTTIQKSEAATRTIQQTIQRTVQRTGQKVKPILKVGKGGIIWRDEKPTRIRRKVLGEALSDMFIGQIRRRGKWFDIGKPTTFERALKSGLGKVQTTLGASLRIKRTTGEIVSLKPPSAFFRPSKKEKGVIIQKRRFRLSAIGEVKEIIKAKKSKGGRFKWF